MLKINDLPLKSINNSGLNGNVVVTLSSPYFISPSTIQVDILQITNKSSIQSMSWSVMPVPEVSLPALTIEQNSVSFESAYYFAGMVLQLSVLLKTGEYQYYHIPVILDEIPPFEAACAHFGDYLEFHTNASGIRLEVNGVNLGDISLMFAEQDDIIYDGNGIQIKYYYSLIGVYNHILAITSTSSSSEYTPNTIEFFTGEDSYSVHTSLSNFPFIFNEGHYTNEVDLSNLGYDTNGYFIADNCCFSQAG